MKKKCYLSNLCSKEPASRHYPPSIMLHLSIIHSCDNWPTDGNLKWYLTFHAIVSTPESVKYLLLASATPLLFCSLLRTNKKTHRMNYYFLCISFGKIHYDVVEIHFPKIKNKHSKYWYKIRFLLLLMIICLLFVETWIMTLASTLYVVTIKDEFKWIVNIIQALKSCSYLFVPKWVSEYVSVFAHVWIWLFYCIYVIKK